jgi:excisionase family DNA binding protein
MADAADFERRRRALATDAFTSPGKASRELGLSRRWLHDAVARGEVDAYRFGARTRVKVADVRRWLEQHRQPPRR